MKPLTIQKMIYEVRGQKVMFDFDLAELYSVPTGALNQAVKRNNARFPAEFMFRLEATEWDELIKSQLQNRSQFVIGSQKHRTVMPFAFTEHGVAMLACVVRSEEAIAMNIAIVKAFIEMRRVITETNELSDAIKKIRETVSDHEDQLKKIFGAIRMLLLDRVKQKKWEEREQIGFYQKANK